MADCQSNFIRKAEGQSHRFSGPLFVQRYACLLLSSPLSNALPGNARGCSNRFEH